MDGKIRVSIVATSLDGHKTQSNTVLNMVSRIQNRNDGFSEGLFSTNTKIENNTFNSIDGATALKLDEKFEANQETPQHSFINDIEQGVSEPENKNFVNQKEDENIPSGVSIESASYIEQNNANSSNESGEENLDVLSEPEEEHTPKLFSEDSQLETENDVSNDNEIHSEKLFDQDTNEEEDFEIPAFLRKQKF